MPDNEDPSTINIGDRVWFDTNSDGSQDDPEAPAIPGVTVTLVSSGGPSQVTTTDAQGNYLFTGVPQSEDAVIHFDYSTADTSGLPGQPSAADLTRLGDSGATGTLPEASVDES